MSSGEKMVLKASVARTSALLLLPALGVAQIWWTVHLPDWSLPLWAWWLVAPMLGLCLWGLAFVLYPPRLVLDANGLTWTQVGWRKRYRWADLADAGLARHPQTVGMTGNNAFNEPMIGFNFKPGRNPARNAARAAYRKSITGYDVNVLSCFNLSANTLVGIMNERIRQADAVASGAERGSSA